MAAAPPPPPPPPPRPAAPSFISRVGGKPGLTILLAVAVTLLLVLAMLALGAPVSTHQGGGSSGVSFSSAKNTAETTTTTSPPGSWKLIDAVGLDVANATTEPLNLSSLSANCTVTSLTGPLPSSLTIPQFTGNLTSGDAAAWDFAFLQPTTLSEIAVIVTGGSVDLGIEISGAHCLSTNETAFGGIPNTIVDSTVAASAVAAAGATEFLAAHPVGVSLEMILFPFSVGGPQISDNAPEWLFSYSTCPIDFEGGTQAPGVTFQAAVNATSGQLLPGSVTAGTCGTQTAPPPGIYSAFQLGPPTLGVGPGKGGTLASQGCTSGDYCYSLPITMTNASLNVTPEDFLLEVVLENATGPPTAYNAVGFAILDATGQVVVYANGSIATSWVDGVGTPNEKLTAGMSFSLDLGALPPPTTNLSLEITGLGPYSGSAEGIGL